MKTKEQIIEWLKSKDWFDAFAKNISFKTVDEVIEECLKEESVIGIIDFAFIWSNTDEGQDFWCNADREFRKWFNSADEQPSEDEQTEQSSDRWIFDRGSKEAPFYVVYAHGKALTTLKYASMEQATKEADRFAKSLNRKTYVLAAVMEIRPEVVTSAVGIDDMEHEEDCPF